MDTPYPEDEFPELPPRTGRSIVILAVIGLFFLAVLTLILFDAFGSDETLAIESTVRQVLDERYERDSLPTWCTGGCSASDDEWHTSHDALVVTEELVGALTEAGLDAIYEVGPPGAYLVKIADGTGLDIGVTGAEWGRATAFAEGTAVWFTSVSIFDEQTGEA